MIVEAAPIVPKDDDGARVPILAFTDGVDDARDPRRAVIFRFAEVI